ncbi:MAG: tetratricopeptide repeat protein, partial [Myxococcales bacterium]|nr:tetratricopeptide repeat protein [Myxococcales bacterium]
MLELRSAQLPASSPEIGELLVNIATCRGSLGDVEGAIAGLRRALQIFEESFGPEDARVAVVLNNLGGFEADAGRPDEAVALRRRALALHVRNHGPDSQEAAHAHVTIARVLVGMGRVDEARVELAAARRFYDREPGYQLGERSLEMTEGRLLWLEGQHARARLHLLALRERILRDRSKSDVLALIATWFAEHGGPPTADELEVVTRALDASDAGVTRGAALDPG